jgi:regulatory protein
MQITRVARQKRRSEWLNIHVDGEFRVTLPEEVVLRSSVRPGSSITEEELTALEAESAAWRTRDSALLLLSYRPRTEQELKRRLLKKSFPEDAIEECIERLKESKLVDDDAFARAFTSERLRNRPSGRARLLAELRAKGIHPEIAVAAIEAALDGGVEGELEMARRAAMKFRRRPAEESLRARRRLHGFLARRGFSGEAIRTIIKEQSF